MKKHDLTKTHLHRVSPGMALYAAFAGVTMAAMLCQPAFAATVWEKANEIMKDVYIRAGNEYARAQYGVTIDTDLTAENASYFPGTADSVAWLAANGGREALNRAVRGNVDATFQYLAAMDGADAVRAYARFNCTVRYSAASDEYIVVVLYG